jgi:CRP-like cAMP-binding protein
MISSEELLRFSLLAGLEPAFVEELASISESKSVQKGEWLFHEGDNADALYLIVSGSIELIVNLDQKRAIRATLNILNEGHAIGWSAIVKPYIYTLGARVSSDAHLVRIDGKQLRTLLEAHPEQGYILMSGIAQTMATRLNTLSERVPSLSLRLIISSILFALGVLTGILVGIFVFASLLAAIGGYYLEGILITLPFLMIPMAFLWLARKLAPA